MYVLHVYSLLAFQKYVKQNFNGLLTIYIIYPHTYYIIYLARQPCQNPNNFCSHVG